MDSEWFRVELDTHGFRTQLMEIGARNLVRRLAFEGDYVTSIVWLRSWGTSRERDFMAAADDARTKADAA